MSTIVTFRVDRHTAEELQLFADLHDISRSEVSKRAVIDYLRAHREVSPEQYAAADAERRKAEAAELVARYRQHLEERPHYVL